jgi:iron complex transport system ATP-binding protein
MTLHLEQVCWNTDDRSILNQVDLGVAPGEFVGLIGPNGSGKSSLLRCIYRALRPDSGVIWLNGYDIWTQLKPRDIAQQSATVLQESPSEFDFTVHDIVMMGRNPHKRLLDNDSEEDYRLVADALSRVGLSDFADRNYQTLSGGEKQRALVARALTQQAKLMILDEPTNHLDIFYQLEILDLVKTIGVTTLAALHDLNLAALYCDRIYVMKEGGIVVSGPPEHVLSADLIRDVYRVNVDIKKHPDRGTLSITYLPNYNKNKCRSKRCGKLRN